MDVANDLNIPYIIYYHDSTFNAVGHNPLEAVPQPITQRLLALTQLPSQVDLMARLSEKLHNKRHFRFASTYKHLSSLYENRMLLVPSVIGLELPQLLPPTTRLVGMYADKDVSSKKPSNGHEKVLLSWLNAGNQSDVLFCQFSDEALPTAAQLSAIIEGGVNAGFRVLMAVRHEVLSLLGVEYNDLIKQREDSVNLVPYAPLRMVLSSKVVKVFLYQGADWHTVAEGVYAGAPFLLMPATLNHKVLAEKLLWAKLGLLLDHRNVTEETVASSIRDLLVDKTRRRIIKRMKWLQTVNDQAGSFVNGSVLVIQEVLAAGGYNHLVRSGKTEEELLRRLTQYGVDVFVLGLLVCFLVVQGIILWLVWCCCRASKTSKIKYE